VKQFVCLKPLVRELQDEVLKRIEDALAIPNDVVDDHSNFLKIVR